MNNHYVQVESGSTTNIIKQVADHACFALAFCMIFIKSHEHGVETEHKVEKPDFSSETGVEPRTSGAPTLFLKSRIGVLNCQNPLHLRTGPGLDILVDIIQHSLKRFDIDGGHVLQYSSPQSLTMVRHGAVLHGSCEHNHVPGLPFHLDCVLVEILLVVRVAGVLVGVWSDSSATIFTVEICEKGDKLD